MNRKGISIVGVLVASVITILVFWALIQMISFLQRRSKGIELHGELESIRQELRQQLSCSMTLNAQKNPNYVPGPPSSCTGPILLYGKNGNLLTDNQGKLGSWTLRTSCDSNQRIWIKAVIPTAPNTYLKDPSLGAFFDEDHPKAKLFGTLPAPCVDRGGNNGEPFHICGSASPAQTGCVPASTLGAYFSCTNCSNLTGLTTVEKYRVCTANCWAETGGGNPACKVQFRPIYENNNSVERRWFIGDFTGTVGGVIISCYK